MTDSTAILSTLRRPRLLVRAARFGLADYDRNRALPRLFKDEPDLGAEALDRLLDVESDLDCARRAGSATYSASSHVEVLTALLGEARLAARTTAG